MGKTGAKKKRIVAFMMSFLMTLSVFASSLLPSMTVSADGGSGKESSNIHCHNYRYGTWYSQWNWAEVSNSYIYFSDDGPVRVEALTGEGKLLIEYYSPNLKFESSKTIDFELPIFGGFYCGKDALYVMYGQQNTAESDDCEVVRVVKYDKSWKRIKSLSFKGINTYIPFDAGGSDFAEYGNMLYIRTCHEMYAKDDGVHHQANMTFAINTDSMTEVSSYWIVMNSSCGYVSHSFNQFIRIDGDKIVAVDHGDAYPRSVLIGTYYKTNASKGILDTYGGYKSKNLVDIPGTKGDNFTGTSVGGFEISNDNYMVVVSKVNYDSNFSTNKVRNATLLLQPKGDFSAETKTIQLTNYAEGSGKGCGNPYIVKVSDNEFVIMWEVLDTSSSSKNSAKATNTFQAVAVDGKGNLLSSVVTMEGDLSDCKPIAYNNKIAWYVTDNSSPYFYVMDPASASLNTQKIDSKAGSSENYFSANLTDEQKEQIKSFVERFYQVILDRTDEQIAADSAGVDDWTNKLITREKKGADVARGFVMSKEFQNKGLGNDEFVKRMYNAFFDREPDEGGYNGWMNKLSEGYSREYVLAGFVNSQEFKNLCAKYGITPGNLTVNEQPKQNNNTQQSSSQRPPLKLDSSNVDKTQLDDFVERLYDKVLDRVSDEGGKTYWMDAIIEGHDDKGNVYDAAIAIRKGFFESKEYLNKNRNDDEFLTDLYWAFFNREPDAEGYAYWQNKMKNEGYTRQRVIDEGFGHSKEFKNLLISYGFKIIE